MLTRSRDRLPGGGWPIDGFLFPHGLGPEGLDTGDLGWIGAAIAHLAARRGMKVALLEKGDFASGTSSKSTKLIHGGIRYLENLEVDLVYESLRERHLQLKVAPHLVKPLPFVIPVELGLLDAEGVAVMPGDSFGRGLAGWLRLSLTVEDALIETACTRILAHAARAKEVAA
jgi:glycine/D-amino acid oxidase-like deaminating enzyme